MTEAHDVARGRWPVFGGWLAVDPSAPDWRRHPVSGVPSPATHWARLSYSGAGLGGDVKEIWEINRHRGVLRLAQAWYLEGDGRWLHSLGNYLDSWLTENPPGQGINWASSLEVAFRALAWTWIRALTGNAPVWTPERDRAFAASLWHHARHLMRFDSVHHSPNTHLTGEGLALAVLGRAWPDWPGARDWAALGDAILLEELQRQVLADGMHVELSPGYHRYTVEFYLVWLMTLQRAGVPVPEQVRARVADMAEALGALRRPDGRLPGIGDEDGGVALPLSVAHPRDPAPVIALAMGVLGSGSWSDTVPSEALDLAWWLLDDASWRRLTSPAPPRSFPRVYRMSVAGYHILREAEAEGWWCLVDAGPQAFHLPGHTHCDLGHVEIQWRRQACVTDPGSLAYGPDQARRDRDRSAESHAVLSVAGAPLAEPAGPFRWARLAPTPRTTIGTHADWSVVALAYSWTPRGGTRIRHERQVALMDGTGILIVDRLIGATGRIVTLTWPVPAPVAGISLDSNKDEAVLPGAVRLRWAAAGVSSWMPRIDAADFADTYRAASPGSFLRLSGEAAQEVLLVSWFTVPEQAPVVSTVGGTVRVERLGRRPVELGPGLA